jgi:hypothetical protein
MSDSLKNDLPIPDRSSVGDLTDLLSAEMPNRLDWLDVDEERYRVLDEVLPHQNLDSVPELEAAWAQLGQDAPGALARLPTNQGDWHPTLETPFWSERVDAPGPSDQRRALKDLLQHLRGLLESGLVGDSLTDALRSRYSEDILERDASVITAARSRWEGRLGHLYVDAELHEGCAGGKKGRSAALKSAIASSAPYALQADKCGGCVLAQAGRCSVLNKELVHRIDLERSPLTEEDWTKARTASPLIASLSAEEVAALSKVGEVGVRMRKAAILADRKARHGAVSASTSSSKALSPRTARELEGAGMSAASVLAALKEGKSPDPLRVLKAHTRERLRLHAERLLTTGSAGLDLKLASAQDPHMMVLAQQAPLFGRLYVDVSYWPSRQAALEALAHAPDQARNVPFVLGEPGGAPTSPDFLRMDVQQAVLARWAAVKGGAREGAPLPAPFRKEAASWLRDHALDPTAWEKLATEVYQTPLPVEVKSYADLSGLRLSAKNLKWGAMKESLLQAEGQPAAVADPLPRIQLQQLLVKMAGGDHSQKVRAEIDLLPPELRKQASFHWGLLGRFYTLSELTAPGHKKASAALPVKSPDQGWGAFLSQQPVMDRLAKRVVEVWGPAKGEVILKKALASGPLALLKVARKSWASKTAVAEWSGPVVYKEAARLLWEGARGVDWDTAVAHMRTASSALPATGSDWTVPVAGSDNLKARQVAALPHTPAHGVLAGWAHGRKAALWATLASGVQGGAAVADLLQRRTASDHGLKAAAEDPHRQGMLVDLFKREEGLLGGAYVLASSAEDCRKAPKSKTARRVLAQPGKCEGCSHRQVNGSCGVYGLPVVAAEDLTYDTRDLRVALSAAAGRGVMSSSQVNKVLKAAEDAPSSKLRGLIKAVHLKGGSAALSGGKTRKWAGVAQHEHVADKSANVPAAAARLLDWASSQVAAGALRRDVVRGVQAGWAPHVTKTVVSELREILSKAAQAPSLAVMASSSEGAASGAEEVQSFQLQSSFQVEVPSLRPVKSAGLDVSLKGGGGNVSLNRAPKNRPQE